MSNFVDNIVYYSYLARYYHILNEAVTTKGTRSALRLSTTLSYTSLYTWFVKHRENTTTTIPPICIHYTYIQCISAQSSLGYSNTISNCTSLALLNKLYKV